MLGFSTVTRFGRIALAGLVGLAVAQSASAAGEEDDPWPDLREALFAERLIADGAGVIRLEAPYRAYDAAIVPISVVAEMAQAPGRYIKTITLIVDKNPAPVAAVFGLSPRNGSATISTRIRVNEYTNVRAIAETNDGALYMATRFVKAAGGCSAPAGKDHEVAMARLGRMKLNQPERLIPGVPNQIQLLVSHPNYSGLQMDQLTRHFVPAHYVTDVKVTYGERTLLTMEGGISLSENPSIHFSFVPEGPGNFSVWVRDSDEQTFTGRWPASPAAGS